MDVIKFDPRRARNTDTQERKDHETLIKAFHLLNSRDGVHIDGDNRGDRKVFCDGVEMKECTSCSEEEGWAIHAGSPPTVGRFDDIIEYIKIGKITVEFI